MVNYFTIIDFKKATKNFEDPCFDGEPVQIYEPKDDETITPPEPTGKELINEIEEIEKNGEEEIIDKPPINTADYPDPENEPVKKFYMKNIEIKLIGEQVKYYGKDGHLITEALTDFTRKTIKEEYSTLDEFIKKWKETDRKQVIIDELLENGVLLQELQDEVKKAGKRAWYF